MIFIYFLHCNWFTLEMAEQPRQRGKFTSKGQYHRSTAMTKVGKLRSKTPKTYDVLDEHFYSRHPDTVLMDDTSIGQNCEIDP